MHESLRFKLADDEGASRIERIRLVAPGVAHVYCRCKPERVVQLVTCREPGWTDLLLWFARCSVERHVGLAHRADRRLHEYLPVPDRCTGTGRYCTDGNPRRRRFAQSRRSSATYTSSVWWTFIEYPNRFAWCTMALSGACLL